MGYRFRLNAKKLPGRPDIVLPKYKIVILVHGCFWHRHKGCKNCTAPTNRREWWLKKINGNAPCKHARVPQGTIDLERIGSEVSVFFLRSS